MQLRFEKKKFHVSKLCILVVRYLTYEIEKILLCTINKVGLRMNVNVIKNVLFLPPALLRAVDPFSGVDGSSSVDSEFESRA
jgi:hypothetical protein